MTILGPKKGIPSLAAARLQRWVLILTAYDYDLQFKPTQQHSNADTLSRLPLPDQTPTYSAEDFNVYQIEALPVTSTAVIQATRTDPL